MEVTESLATAREAIKGADLPESWQVPAFIEVLRHLMTGAGANGNPGGGGASGTPQGGAAANPGAVDGDGHSPAARLAARVKVSEASLLDVFDFSDEGVSLHVASSRIPASKSKATQDVALLIVAARQGSGIDAGWTSAEHVRAALQHYNKYDQSNFSANLKGADNAFNSKGKGPSLELRLTQPGWETAIALIRRIAGVGE